MNFVGVETNFYTPRVYQSGFLSVSPKVLLCHLTDPSIIVNRGFVLRAKLLEPRWWCHKFCNSYQEDRQTVSRLRGVDRRKRGELELDLEEKLKERA